MGWISPCVRVQFVRVQSSTDPVLVYQMLTEEWGLASPHLVVALVGGDEQAQMKPWLRDTLRKGLVKAAQSTGNHPGTSSGLGFLTQNAGNRFCCSELRLLLSYSVYILNILKVHFFFAFVVCLTSLGFRKVPLCEMYCYYM